MQCPFCHQNTPENSLFCERCGSKLNHNELVMSSKESSKYNRYQYTHKDKQNVVFEPYYLSKEKELDQDNKSKITFEPAKSQKSEDLLECENQNSWKRKKRNLYAGMIACLVLIAVAIGFATVNIPNIVIDNEAKIQTNYENAIENIIKGNFVEAKISLRKVELQKDSYKNSKQLATYLKAKELHSYGSVENYDDILNILKEIKTDYNGDLKNEINALRTYVEEEQRAYRVELQREARIDGVNKALNDFVSIMKQQAIDEEINNCPIKILDYKLELNSENEPVITIKPENQTDKIIKSFSVMALCYTNEYMPVVLNISKENMKICTDTNGFKNGEEISWTLSGFTGAEQVVPIVYGVDFEKASWKFPNEYKAFLLEYCQNRLIEAE